MVRGTRHIHTGPGRHEMGPKGLKDFQLNFKDWKFMSMHEALVEAIKPFALDEYSMRKFLNNLNDLPLFDIRIHLGEIELLFIQEKDSGCFKDAEINGIEDFFSMIASLPDESDIFWDMGSLSGKEWKDINKKAESLLILLGEEPR